MPMNIKSRLIILIVFHLLFAAASSVLAETLQGRVVKVADGDTVTIVDRKGFKYRIRVAGIDAPEESQAYGEESTKNLGWLTYSKGVTVEYSKHDRYGRIVGKILVDPQGDAFCLLIECIRTLDVGLEQVKAGLAWHYKHFQNEQSKEDRRLYSSAERGAKKKQVGLWGNSKHTPPWEWRRNNKLKAISKTFKESMENKKKFAAKLNISTEQLEGILNETIENAFRASGLSEEEFAVEFNVSPKELKSILEGKNN